MVPSNNRNKRGNLTLDELFKRLPPQKRPSSEDEDLQLAMEMSQREHINEQKRLLEQYALLSQKQFRPSTPSLATATMIAKKKRLIKVEPEEEEERIENFTDDDDSQWFQTVSMRSQQPPVKKAPSKPKPKPKPKQKEASKQKSKRHIPLPPPTFTSATASTSSMHNDTSSNITIVKREDAGEVLLDIDDVDEWLEVKAEHTEASEPALEITDLDAYLDNYQNEEDMDQEPKSVITIDDQEEQHDIPPSPQASSPHCMPCPMCQKLFKQGRDIQEHAASCNNMVSDTDSDSDCDIIDLINPANTVISKQTSTPPPSLAEASTPVLIEGEEEDGYLSPLEGFTSIKNNQNEAFNPYFQQLQQPTPKPRKARATRKSTTTKRGNGRGRFRPYRRKKKS
ncbi:NADH dehydrogenase [ubiquinone] 1 alpha subcomplex subunit [Mucor velutinosus]|uniref:NADH dehydrogenase [ubiquinone] 1 alpha subcomplex subunit n=1 Tax=Mucor velutinosus TaxID=708070 RepID=A0AAN7DRZ1_9FUNG|nr:NADH dehydrogenase [ubiquinone] 1 alpha subcomplex subunit [Mucor velutinosus]